MKRMPSGGYTIIEVMMFLLISTALLGSTTAMISGRQERIRFTNSVETFEQKMKDILNDVSTGYYPSAESFNCEPDGAGGIILNSGGNDNEKGTNTGCVFLGKAIELKSGAGSEYNTYTVVGAKDTVVGGKTKPATNLAEANAKLLGMGEPGVVDRNSIEADVEIIKVISRDDTARSVSGIAMISEFSVISTVDNNVSGNAANITLYEVPGDSGSSDFANNAGTPTMVRTEKGIIVCLQQGGAGGNGRKAAIIIGGNNQQFSTETKIDKEAAEAVGC